MTRGEALQGPNASREGMTPTVAHKVILAKHTRKSLKAIDYIWQVAASCLITFCCFVFVGLGEGGRETFCLNAVWLYKLF